LSYYLSVNVSNFRTVMDRTHSVSKKYLNLLAKVVKNKKLERAEIIARHSSPVTVLKWRDKRNLTTVSTYHSADTQRASNKGMKQRSLCA